MDVQVINKGKGQSTSDLVRKVEGAICYHAGVIVKEQSLTHPIENWYEIPGHGAIIGLFAPDDNKIKAHHVHPDTDICKLEEVDGILCYLGFGQNDKVYAGLREDLSNL